MVGGVVDKAADEVEAEVVGDVSCGFLVEWFAVEVLVDVLDEI